MEIEREAEQLRAEACIMTGGCTINMWTTCRSGKVCLGVPRPPGPLVDWPAHAVADTCTATEHPADAAAWLPVPQVVH